MEILDGIISAVGLPIEFRSIPIEIVSVIISTA